MPARETVLVGVLAAAAGAATAGWVLEATSRPASARAAGGGAEAEFRAALSGVERELAAIRVLLAERPSAAVLADPGAVIAPRAAPAPPADPAATGAAAATDPPMAPPGTSSPSSAPRPADAPERLRSLRTWYQDAGLRREWLFTPEADLVTRLGTPDFVAPGTGTSEVWTYTLLEPHPETGVEAAREVKLTVNRGRLVQVNHN